MGKRNKKMSKLNMSGHSPLPELSRSISVPGSFFCLQKNDVSENTALNTWDTKSCRVLINLLINFVKILFLTYVNYEIVIKYVLFIFS